MWKCRHIGIRRDILGMCRRMYEALITYEAVSRERETD